MSLIDPLYDLGMRVVRVVLPRLPGLSEKVSRSLEGRRGLLERIDAWSGSSRGDGRLVWFHAASVGEALQTQPVIEELRAAHSDIQVFFSYFSSSAESIAKRMAVDYADYLPLDVADDVARAFDLVRPDVLVFGKYDVWPTAARLANERGIRLALINGTLAADSSRGGLIGRSLLSAAYARLDAAGAISTGDADRLEQLGVARERIRVTGDARFDQVIARARAVELARPPLAFLTGHAGPTLVAGSTWPDDEGPLAAALTALRRRHTQLRAVIAPHEPTERNLSRLRERLAGDDLQAHDLSALSAASIDDARIILVDSVGLLAELYAIADVAMVGGAFGREGIHSVLEPAALGVPVIFGPHHSGAREAGELIERGSGVAVANAQELEASLDRWLRDEPARERAGAAAREYVLAGSGAAGRNAELVLALLDAR